MRAREAHGAGGEHAVGIRLVRPQQAVGSPQDRRGEVLELLALVVPCGAVVAFQVRILAQLGIGVCGEHLAVGVHVHAAAFGLLQKLLEVVQVVAGDHDEGARLDLELNRRRLGPAVGGDVRVLQSGHGGQVDLAALEDQGQQLVHAQVGADGPHALVQERRHGRVRLPQRLRMVGIRRHAAHAEKQQALQAADILLRVPQLAHVVRVEFAQGDGLSANAALEGGDGLGVEADVAHAGEHALEHKPVGLGIPPSAALCSGQGDQRPGQLVLQPSRIGGLAAYAGGSGAGGASRRLLALEAEHVPVSHLALLDQRVYFRSDCTILLCLIRFCCRTYR